MRCTALTLTSEDWTLGSRLAWASCLTAALPSSQCLEIWLTFKCLKFLNSQNGVIQKNRIRTHSFLKHNLLLTCTTGLFWPCSGVSNDLSPDGAPSWKECGQDVVPFYSFIIYDLFCLWCDVGRMPWEALGGHLAQYLIPTRFLWLCCQCCS